VSATVEDDVEVGPTVSYAPDGWRARVQGVADDPAIAFLILFGLGVVRFVVAHRYFDTVWAEDGIFLQNMLDNGPTSIAMTHVGYLHVVPRTLTVLIAALPAAWAPVGYAATAIAVTAAIGTYIVTAGPLVSAGRSVNCIVGTAVVCLPIAGAEAFGNGANLQQFLWVGAAWVAVAPPPHTLARRILASAIGAGAAMSSPLALLLVPVFAIRLRRLRVISIVYLAGAAIHLAFILDARSERNGIARGDGNVVHSFRHYLRWVIGGIVQPDSAAWTAASVLAVATIATLAVATRGTVLRPLVLLGVSFVYWYVSTGLGQGLAPRHTVAPAILAVWALAELAARARVMLPVAFGLTVCWAFGIGLSGARTQGPSWIDAVHQAPPCDTTWQLPLAPNTWGYVAYPCDRL
jgi:hypothetical protein